MTSRNGCTASHWLVSVFLSGCGKILTDVSGGSERGQVREMCYFFRHIGEGWLREASRLQRKLTDLSKELMWNRSR
jgi:hypothetical protein